MKSYWFTSLTTRMANTYLLSCNLSTYYSSCLIPSWRIDYPPVLGLHGKVLKAGGLASVRRHYIGHSQFQLAPMDLPLAKAELTSDAGDASVIMYLRKGEKCCSPAVRKCSEKI